MKSVLDALNKFLNGEIDSEQLLAELSFNISECFNSLSDEDLKQKLAALKKELYKSDGDFVKIKQMAKVCRENLKRALNIDGGEAQQDLKEAQNDSPRAERESVKGCNKECKAHFSDSFYDDAAFTVWDGAKEEGKTSEVLNDKGQIKKTFAEKISEKFENASNQIDDAVSKAEDSLKKAGEKIKSAFKRKK